MICDSDSFTYTPYIDSRGESGWSGQLLLATDKDGKRYLVKHAEKKDISNEYLGHAFAKKVGVPTSDAILIRSSSAKSPFKLPVAVGIAYEEDFRRFNADLLVGTERYPDSHPYTLDFFRQMGFRYMISLDDNIQVAVARGRLISFDYAESFLALNSWMIRHGYEAVLEVMRRKDSIPLLDAYLESVYNYAVPEKEIVELESLGYTTSYYRRYFDGLSKIVDELTKE